MEFPGRISTAVSHLSSSRPALPRRSWNWSGPPAGIYQKAELLKDSFHAELEKTREEDDIPGLVHLGYWCRVTDTFEVREDEALIALSEHHLWTDDYAQKRVTQAVT